MIKDFFTNIILVGAAVFGLSQVGNQNLEQKVIAQSSPIISQPLTSAPAQNSQRLHKMSLELSQPEDLKIAIGDVVSAGQVIADQVAERQKLNIKKEELTLSLKRVEESKIVEPIKISEPEKPKEPAPLLALPEISYQQHEAAISKAQSEVKQAEEVLSLKRREIDFIKGIAGIDPAIIEHEQSRIAELENKLENAESELELAEGKLLSAKAERARDEYQHQLNLARRTEEQNQALSFYQKQVSDIQMDYQRQLTNFQNEIRERDYQTTQLKLQLSAIDDKISQLAIIRSPYSGQVKRIRFTGQNDNKLNVEVSLIINAGNTGTNSSPATANPLDPGGN